MQRTTVQILLAAAAVLTGVVVLAYAFDNSSDSTAEPEPEAVATPTPGEVPQPTPTVAPVANTAVVLVANSTGVDGLAGAASTLVSSSLGHQTLDATDATGEPLAASVVYFQPGFDAEAAQVAAALRFAAGATAAMPAAPPVTDLGGAQILVVLGLDQVPSE